jgi:Lipocalin-like domain
VIHTIEIAWDGARIGEDQVRFYKIEGERLTLRTTLNRSPTDGREGIGVLTFERIRPPAVTRAGGQIRAVNTHWFCSGRTTDVGRGYRMPGS